MKSVKVKKGSKSTIVIYNKATKREVKDEATGEVETKTSWFQRYYRVFNGAQIDGLDKFEYPEVEVDGFDHEDEGYPEAALISTEWCDTLGGGLRHGSDRAFYTPQLDSITMPDVDQFKTLDAYYHTLFHEIAHSTGHKSRTNRLDEGVRLVVTCMLRKSWLLSLLLLSCVLILSVPLDDSQSAAYLKAWAARCREEPKLLFSAANAAQFAARYGDGEYLRCCGVVNRKGYDV
jgi:antirestriction protein ArdC